MRSLCLLRHAKSSWKHPELADHDRPLNGRGKRDAPRMGALLAALGPLPDLVLCSSARRARDTAFRALPAAEYTGEVRVSSELYMADAEQIAACVRRLELDPKRLLVIGHNPGLEELIEALLGRTFTLVTGGLVALELELDHWRALSLGRKRARLVGSWQPKTLAVEP